MKVAPEHYNMVKTAIANVLTAQQVTKAEVENNYSELSEQRKLWDIYHAAMQQPYAKMIVLPMMNQYNDSHIETAVKKAWSEIL